MVSSREFRAWIKIIWENYIYSTLFLIGCATDLLTEISYDRWPETEGVSSFYGPGTFLAWLLGLGLILKTYMTPGSRDVSLLHTLGRVVIFGYTAFAAGDALIRTAHNSRLNNDAQLRAAVNVCRYAVLFSGISQFPYTLFIPNPLDWWAALLGLVAPPIIFSEFLLCYGVLGVLRALTPVIIWLVGISRFNSEFGILFGTCLTYSWMADWLLYTFSVIMAGDANQTVHCLYDGGTFRTKLSALAWPRSSVAWDELDQVAALTSAIVSVLLTLFKMSILGSNFLERWKQDQRTPELLRRILGYLETIEGP